MIYGQILGIFEPFFFQQWLFQCGHVGIDIEI